MGNGNNLFVKLALISLPARMVSFISAYNMLNGMDKKGQGHMFFIITAAIAAIVALIVVVVVFIKPIPDLGRKSLGVIDDANKCICDPIGESSVCAATPPSGYMPKDIPGECAGVWTDCETSCWKVNP